MDPNLFKVEMTIRTKPVHHWKPEISRRSFSPRTVLRGVRQLSTLFIG